ncbi:MAG: helicase HerA-like domain-containing protein, partial [Methyloceanibacter sp.]
MAKRKAAPKESQGRSETPAAAPEDSVYIGKSVKPEFIYLRLANRHGLVTGATGTGKTVSLQVLAEGFARAGVPVFAADIKGD